MMPSCERPAVQRRRPFGREVALAEQGFRPFGGQPIRLAPIRENHCGGGVRLIDGRDDVAVRDQLLDLEGVLLAKAA